MSENRARDFFGDELRRKRKAAGLTGKELADALGCTPQWVSTLENGRKASEQSAHDLDTFFKTDGLFHRMWELAMEIEIQTVVPPGFTEYVGYEKTADRIRIFSTGLISGLFQTERYAYTVISAMMGSDADRLVAERMERKSIFAKDDPPHTFLVLDESVIRRSVGGPEIMRQQLAYLLEVAQRPRMMLQIVPYKSGCHVGLTGSSIILGFENGPEVAYTESSGEGVLLRQSDRVALQNVRWDLIQCHTIPSEESLAMIQHAMEQL
ncbi:helix-turn-helix domain-containing protein [Actinomadura decatromicini]|uniref:Helix-turn-helix domain-containing protein n=1 Tax=Actinomadura decatromicini TaxID=2604572 RepID=A0A5D3F5U4_9ACTN|nr:helix-turn-helix transcriptional regulator [Actinomadura decatromicini]TYK43288.1 helix-turn-helix domain-containing protein [Actinomadura decatromicini]